MVNGTASFIQRSPILSLDAIHDLTDLSYTHHGLFVNIVARY